jgi:hypothetical protein
MKKLITFFLSFATGLFAVDVTFTVVDNSWSNTDVMYKGTATDWSVVQMYDDGTNGDATADDHTWTVVVDVAAGDHNWGAIDTRNGDGTSCEACDGDDGYGTWLIQGDNPAYAVSETGDITGVTSYTIDAFTSTTAGTIVFTVNDRSESYVSVEYKGTATDWAIAPMFDDGTNGDINAGDHIWTVTIPDIEAGDHEWGAVENDGSTYGVWLISGPNPSFTLDEDLLTYHGHTNYTIPAPSGEELVTFTLNDNSWLIEDVMFKGSMSGWSVFQAYDDGTNGDATADDHIWTAQYVAQNGDHQWGGISTENEDGTVCVLCDGSDGYGTWLIDGGNPEFSVLDGTISGVVDYVIPADMAVSEGSVMFTVHDGTESYVAVEYKGTPTEWATVPMHDDGTNGDEVAGDFIWSVIIPDVTAGDHNWGAVENDGTTYGAWLIEGDNPAFNLEEDLMTLHGLTDYVIEPAGGAEVTKTVLFNVDMTEWLDEEGNMGMRAFNIANGDEVQVRGSFNGWGECIECTMTRTPGTNIFSHAIEVTNLYDNENQFAYYMNLSDASLASIAERFGSESVVDYIGWETSPREQGNRKFMLGTDDDQSGLLELPMESFYDAFPGSVIPEGHTITATFSIDMTETTDFDSATDTVYIRTNDKWLNLSQGFSDGQDLNHYAATAVGDGIYEFDVPFTGPLPWQIYYKWGFYDTSEEAEFEEAGGGLGGVPRIRYLRQDANDNCAWPSTFHFDLDEMFMTEDHDEQEDWDDESICVELMAIEDNGLNSVPENFSVSDNYPNPFNPSTQVEISLPKDSDISFKVYSINGVEIYSYTQNNVTMGKYTVKWNGKDSYGRSLPSGIYLYEFKAGDQFHQTKKMTLLK